MPSGQREKAAGAPWSTLSRLKVRIPSETSAIAPIIVAITKSPQVAIAAEPSSRDNWGDQPILSQLKRERRRRMSKRFQRDSRDTTVEGIRY
jgi:hypothetical protein